MSEEIKSHHLRALACDIEDCHNPQSWADYCRAAANRIEAQAAEIARLRAALATARREGMEEAHALATIEVWAKKGKVEIARSLLFKGFEVGHLATNSVGVGKTVMDAIRAAAKDRQP